MGKATKKPTTKPLRKTNAKQGTKKRSAYEFNARPAIEINATFRDTIGLTAKVASALASEKVNILAGTGYSASAMFRKAIFTLVVDNYAKAEKALEKIGADDIEKSSIILVDMAHKIGALEMASRIIAKARINIYYVYATTSIGKTATCVFRTADDKNAIRLLNKA
jgi:hypothetical protein